MSGTLTKVSRARAALRGFDAKVAEDREVCLRNLPPPPSWCFVFDTLAGRTARDQPLAVICCEFLGPGGFAVR